MIKRLVGCVAIAASVAMAVPSTAMAQGRGIEIGVPAYVFPGQPMLNDVEAATPPPGIVILNPGNGDAPFDATWQAQADELRAKTADSGDKVRVLGYVYTQRGARSEAAVKASIDNYIKNNAGVHIDGIFFDEGARECGANNVTRDYYLRLKNYVYAELFKESSTLSPVVAHNVGTAIEDCYLASGKRTADIFVTFEGDQAAYQNWVGGNVFNLATGYRMGTEYNSYRFWHLVYGVPQASTNSVIDTAFDRYAGHVYVTDDNLPNPWDQSPTGGFTPQTSYAANKG